MRKTEHDLSNTELASAINAAAVQLARSTPMSNDMIMWREHLKSLVAVQLDRANTLHILEPLDSNDE